MRARAARAAQPARARGGVLRGEVPGRRSKIPRRGRAMAQRRGRAVPVGKGLGSHRGDPRDPRGAQEHDREGGAERHLTAVLRPGPRDMGAHRVAQKTVPTRRVSKREGAPGGCGHANLPTGWEDPRGWHPGCRLLRGYRRRQNQGHHGVPERVPVAAAQGTGRVIESVLERVS